MSVNKVILIGRLGQDPEVKQTPSGSSVCNFSLATNENWIDKSGQKQERTEWHRIVVWGKQAETCGQYLSKGREAYIEGKLQTRSWDDKEGQKRYTTEVQALSVRFLGGGASANGDYSQSNNRQDSSGDQKQSQGYNVAPESNFAADDIPF